MANSEYSCVIRIDVEETFNLDFLNEEAGHWTLTSQNLPGLFLAGKDVSAMRADAPNVIMELFRNNYGFSVEVLPPVAK